LAASLGQNGRKFIEENLPSPLLVRRWFHDLDVRMLRQTQIELETVKS